MSGTGMFLGRRTERLLQGIRNYRRALGQKDFGDLGVLVLIFLDQFLCKKSGLQGQ